MSPKTVALDPDAYVALRRHRRTGETFSDAVRRLTGRQRSLLDFAGIWKEMPGADLDRIREYLTEGGRRDQRRLKRLALRR
jgi:predicted CopG family antitoxin